MPPAAVRLIRVLLLTCLSLIGAGARADYLSGRAAEARGDRQRAIVEYVAAADSDARAARALARLHERGTGEGDAGHALRWLRRAGELGDAETQFQLGLRYLHGTGAAKREPREAALWFERAAGSGHPQAQFELGRLLASGPAPQPERARTLIEQAAQGGVREARRWLGQDLPASAEPDADPYLGQEDARDRHRARGRGLPDYWDENPPRVTLHWGIHQGYGNWGWSVWDPYPWYPWGGSPWAWYPFGCAGYWCGPHGHRHGGVRFGFSAGN